MDEQKVWGKDAQSVPCANCHRPTWWNPEYLGSIDGPVFCSDDCKDFYEEKGERCPDCGEPGEIKGHWGCQYPQD